MKCSRALDMFSSYFEGEIEPGQAAALQQHFEECADCHSAYQRFNAAIMTLEEMPEVDTPVGFHAAVMAKVQQRRQVAPRPVKWWQLDWQKVFTIQVPARTAVMACVLLLLMIALASLTNISGSIAGFLVAKHVVPPPVQAPMPWGLTPKTVTLTMNGEGLSIRVTINSRKNQPNFYAITLDRTEAKPVTFDVYRMGTNGQQSSYVVASGSVTGRPAVAEVYPNGTDANVVVVWRYNGQSYRELLFLPAAFSLSGARENVAASLGNTSLYDAFREVSAETGVIVMASGDISKSVSISAGKTAEEALQSGASKANLKLRILANSVFSVGK